MTVNLASYSAPCNIRVITNTFQKRPLKNLVFLRQFNFYRLPERNITLSKFNLKITSWKEEFTGSGTAPFAQGTQLKIHFHYSGCYTNQLGSLGRQSVILQAKVLYSLVLFPSSLGRITDFFLFSWKQISWPQVYWCQGQRKKLATNPSTTFPLHVAWHERGCQELLISSLLSCTERCTIISKVWPARRAFPWLSCTPQQAACFNSDVKTVTILGDPAALSKFSTKSYNFQCEKYPKNVVSSTGATLSSHSHTLDWSQPWRWTFLFWCSILLSSRRI